MKRNKKKGRKTGLFVLTCVIAFAASFAASGLIHKGYVKSLTGKYSVKWNDSIGTVYSDISYGDADANKFDLYVPKDASKKNYGLIVYLHAGGFRTGDKKDDAATLEYYCSLGYVTAGINYTLNSDEHPEANVFSMSMEVKEAVPHVVEKAKELGYNINEMTIAGGSAGGCLALLYAYRDAKDAPVPVKMVFEGVGPSSFYPEDWTCYGTDKDPNTAAGFFSIMLGQKIDPSILGTPAYDELMKPISALLWVDENTVPTVMAYGTYDKLQSFQASQRLDERLSEAGVDHAYIVCEHSGHGLQNDAKQMALYEETVEAYLKKYMPAE